MKNEQANIYFIKARDTMKIGYAKNIQKRMAEMQIGNPYKLQLVHNFKVNLKEANTMENILHSIFRSVKMEGEWFRITKQLVSFIEYVKKYGWSPFLEWVGEYCGITPQTDSIISPSLISLTKTIRKWAVEKEETFTLADVFSYFSLVTLQQQGHARTILCRLHKEEKVIEKIGRGWYSPINPSRNT